MRRAFNYAFDFEEMNKQIFFGQYKRIASYFEGLELAARGLPRGRGARDPRNRARQGAGRCVHQALHQSGRRQPREHPRQSARRRAAAARGRLRDPQPEAGQRQDRRAVLRRVPAVEPGLGALRRALQAVAGAARHHGDACASSTTRSTRTGCGSGTTTSITAVWGQSLSPGNEQRGFWSSQAADQPGSRNLVGIKNPAVDALIERADLRQEPRRARRRDQGARSRAAVERLRRAAMDLRQDPQRALGSLRPSRPAAEIRRLGIPDRLVVGRGEGGQGGTRS